MFFFLGFVQLEDNGTFNMPEKSNKNLLILVQNPHKLC